MLYDAKLRRIMLPKINDWHLGGGAEAARAVTRNLRQRVADAAGPESEWRAREAKVDQLIDDRLERIGVWGLATAIAVGTTIVAVVVLEALTPSLVSDESVSPLLGVVPAGLAFVTTVVVGLVRQRRRGRVASRS